MAIDYREIDFGTTEISYDAAQVVGGLLVEACGEVEDGYTEMAAWSQQLHFKDGSSDVKDTIYKDYLGFPTDVVEASVAYKLVQIVKDKKRTLEPQVVLRGKIPNEAGARFEDFICVKSLADFPEDDGFSHQYLLDVIVRSAA